MKKLMFLGLVVLGSSLMSFTSHPKEGNVVYKLRLVHHVCESGYVFDYYQGGSGFTQADYDEMIDSVCNDPDNN